MTQQKANSLYRTLFFLIITCSIAHGQQDTVVIYETQIVYDTLFVYDTIRVSPLISHGPLIKGMQPARDSLISFLKVNAYGNKALYRKPSVHILQPVNRLAYGSSHLGHPDIHFLCIKSATNPEKDIIVPDCKDTRTKMKRNMSIYDALHVFSQSLEFGLSTGLGVWQAESVNSSLRSKYTATQTMGAYATGSLTEHLRLKVELNYNWLYKNGSLFQYRDILTDDAQITGPSLFDSTALGSVMRWSIDGVGDSSYSFSQFMLPVKLGYTINRFQPYVGATLVYRLIKQRPNQTSWNFCVGLNIMLSEKSSVALNYSRGLKEELQRSGSFDGTYDDNIVTLQDNTQIIMTGSYDRFVERNSGTCISNNLEVVFCYHFSRKKNIRLKNFNP